jgi:hypothetical protein
MSATIASGPFDGKTSADFPVVRGVLGIETAREALKAIRRSQPRAMLFIATPRSSTHVEALRTLLAAEAAALPPPDAVVLIDRFDGTDTVDVVRLTTSDANDLARGVSAVVEMLSSTVPAAFDSDSYRVARVALDEELRSGHDGALDALRRRARAQNIGLVRTTNGYAVVPMHDGRVVQKDVFEALPGSLRTDVEAKLAQFEAELAAVLRNRAVLQQEHRTRVQDLERDAASLAVEAAMATLTDRFSSRPEIARRLEDLRADLVRNALLFVGADRDAKGAPRAPIEIAQDPRFARYRVNVLNGHGRSGGVGAGLELPETLERAELLGVAHASGPGRLTPDGVVPGALTRPGGNLVVIDVRDLMASYAAWPLLKHAMKAARAAPVISGETGLTRAAAFDLPVEARLVVVGEIEDYRAWCRLDPDVTRLVRVIEAFAPALPASPALEQSIAGHLAGFVADDAVLPLDGGGLAAMVASLATTVDGGPALSTDLETARDLLAAASVEAMAAGRVMIASADVAAALAKRTRRADGLMSNGGRA